MNATYTDVELRFGIPDDMPQVMDIELASFEFAWTEEEFRDTLRSRNCIMLVANIRGKIVGFMVYELLKGELHVLNFAVHPDHRREHIGTQMVDKLIAKLPQQHRQTISLEVRESKLAAQLFFRSCGFEAWHVLHDHYEDTDEDAYVMVYEADRLEEAASLESAVRNKMKKPETGDA